MYDENNCLSLKLLKGTKKNEKEKVQQTLDKMNFHQPDRPTDRPTSRLERQQRRISSSLYFLQWKIVSHTERESFFFYLDAAHIHTIYTGTLSAAIH